ncbi:MAG: hypothetical protein U0Q55_19450 [Vicinamibacterales bacterium]
MSVRSRLLPLLPVIAVLALAGGFWTYNTLPFIAEDCYFYAIIARNIALRGVQSYWGTELTNGVHPLWTIVFGAYAWIVSLFSIDALYKGPFGFPLVLLLLGAGAVNWLVVAERARLSKAALVFPQLVYLSIFGLVYSEAHLSFFAHSLLARLAVTEDDDRPRPALIGLAMAAVFLARLDNMFYVAAFGLWYVARRRSLRTVVIAAAACAAPALIYLAVNTVWFGGLTPISGYLKSSFPEPFVRGLRFLGGPAIMFSGYSVPFGWFPLALGVVVAAAMATRLTDRQTLIYPLVAGTALHAVYTGFFTAGFTDWYWYYVLPILLLSWSAACALRALRDSWLDPAAQWGAVALLAAALFATRLHPPDERELPGLKTLRIVRQLGIDRSVLLISEWPGTVGFYTRNEVIAADMLTSNRQLVERMTSGRNAFDVLFEEARAKGSPVQYLFYNGGIFLHPMFDWETVRFMHPRMVNNSRSEVIGESKFGRPFFTSEDGIMVWKLTTPRP